MVLCNLKELEAYFLLELGLNNTMQTDFSALLLSPLERTAFIFSRLGQNCLNVDWTKFTTCRLHSMNLASQETHAAFRIQRKRNIKYD